MTRSSSGSEHKTIRARLTRVGLVPSIILLAIWLAFSAVPIYQGFHSRMVATEIREALWRAQFIGKRHGAQLALTKDIQNISGATLSCRHITDGVKRLLATHAFVLAER